MGYHLKHINKGVYGEFSKIVEEFEELVDAHEQGNPIMELCELSDLLGAMEAYAKKFNINLGDLMMMMIRTQDAFADGTRK